MSLWHPGFSDAWVTYLRLCLNECVYPTGQPLVHFNNVHLGGYGLLTRNAVVRFQRLHPATLSPTGKTDTRTWAALGVKVTRPT
jgi:hypothetical protein